MRASRLFAGAALAALVALPAAAEAQEAHAHIGHVMTGWGDTPDGQGLLPTAKAEAEIARQHAGFALGSPDDLDSIQLHTGHVLHAVDPSQTAGGPGLGYGLVKAAGGVAAHIGLAAAAGDASDNVKLHAEHVAASARNVVAWAGEIGDLAGEIMTTDDAARAAELAGRVQALLGCVSDGCDADGDGTVSWGPGEGGLAQAAQHMTLMMKGEGMM